MTRQACDVAKIAGPLWSSKLKAACLGRQRRTRCPRCQNRRTSLNRRMSVRADDKMLHRPKGMAPRLSTFSDIVCSLFPALLADQDKHSHQRLDLSVEPKALLRLSGAAFFMRRRYSEGKALQRFIELEG